MFSSRHSRIGTTVLLSQLSTTTELLVINLVTQQDPESDLESRDPDRSKHLIAHFTAHYVPRRRGDSFCLLWVRVTLCVLCMALLLYKLGHALYWDAQKSFLQESKSASKT